MKIISIKDNDFNDILETIMARGEDSFSEIDGNVEDIIKEIRKRGDDALIEFTRKFDGITLENIKVSEDEMEESLKSVEKDFIEIITEAKKNIWEFHMKQKQNSWISTESKDITLGQKITPLDRVGIYVPGGKAAYPSTVLMNAIPAKVAGVTSIAMVTPPQRDGKINPYILAAAKISGISEIYKVGGAQAVAALAYGTKTILPVNKIVGPGNIYVARAKKKVFGKVAIDMIAGPSEVCIIADDGANPKFVAADLLSQAEHDELACSILVTTSMELGKAVVDELKQQLETLSRVDIAKKSIEDFGKIFVVKDLDMAMELANEIAPEHLELMIDRPFENLSKIRNAGAIFLGQYSPEPLGDYFAGPNHTLPTNGTAKFSSPLGVDDFVKKSSVIYYGKDALEKVKDKIVYFAEKEGLDAHANSIKVRF